LFFGAMLWSQIEDSVVAGQREAIPALCPLQYKSLIESCWVGIFASSSDRLYQVEGSIQ